MSFAPPGFGFGGYQPRPFNPFSSFAPRSPFGGFGGGFGGFGGGGFGQPQFSPFSFGGMQRPPFQMSGGFQGPPQFQSGGGFQYRNPFAAQHGGGFQSGGGFQFGRPPAPPQPNPVGSGPGVSSSGGGINPNSGYQPGVGFNTPSQQPNPVGSGPPQVSGGFQGPPQQPPAFSASGGGPAVMPGGFPPMRGGPGNSVSFGANPNFNTGGPPGQIFNPADMPGGPNPSNPLSDMPSMGDRIRGTTNNYMQQMGQMQPGQMQGGFGSGFAPQPSPLQGLFQNPQALMGLLQMLMGGRF